MKISSPLAGERIEVRGIHNIDVCSNCKKSQKKHD
jgi:hypothetical protein